MNTRSPALFEAIKRKAYWLPLSVSLLLVREAASQDEQSITQQLKSKVKAFNLSEDKSSRTDLKRLSDAIQEGLENSGQTPAGEEPTQAEIRRRYEFPDFVSGEERHSKDGRLETSLSVIYGEWKAWRPETFDLPTGQQVTNPADVIDMRLRSYEGQPVGPTLRVKAGDVLKVKLSNRLPVEKPANHELNTPSEFNRTNLHLHGLHVTPAGNGDNVMLEIRPGEEHVAEVAIPYNHIPGTFWYHSHVHGTTAVQVSSGMAGALIVEPNGADNNALENIPEIRNAQERICVFQQISYHRLPGGAQPTPVYGVDDFKAAFDPIQGNPLPSRWQAGQRRDGWRTTINGQLQPVLRIKSGKLQRFRMVHAGVRQVINVQLAQATMKDNKLVVDPNIYDLDKLNQEGMKEIAVDGIPLDRMRKATSVQLYPGYRSDTLVRLVNETDRTQYYIMWDGVTAADFDLDPNNPAGTDWTKRPDVLAVIEVEPNDPGTPADNWPSQHDFAKLRHPAPISEHEVVGLQQAELAVANGAFAINGDPYDPAREPLKLKLGRADEWRLTSVVSAAGNPQAHPFHIHVNPFYVVSETENSTGIVTPIGLWRDTLLINGAKTYKVRTRYENYLGDFVIHCHLLDHEDEGMMQGVSVVNSAYEIGTKIASPYLVPMWTLPDAAGKDTSLETLLGDKTILVFLESQECSACNAQMKLFKDRQADLPSGVKVVFVAPGASQGNFPEKDYPFPVVFNSTLDQFVAYQAYSELHRTALHGMFVLDKSRRVRWREVSDKPYVGFDALLRDLKLIK